MAPPAFADIGKEARDVLSKGYCKYCAQTLHLSWCDPIRQTIVRISLCRRCPMLNLSNRPPLSTSSSSHRDSSSPCAGLGVVKLDLKTKTPLAEFNVNGVSNNDTGKVTAFLESKHSCKEYGLTMKERWNADNTLSTELTFDDPFVKGTKVGLNGFFAPQSGRKNGSLKLGYKNDLLNVKSDLNCDHAAAYVVSSAVIGCVEIEFQALHLIN